MELKELKEQIESSNFFDDSLIFICPDNTFLAMQYIKRISFDRGALLTFIDSLDYLEDSLFNEHGTNVGINVLIKDEVDYEFNKHEEVLLIDDYSGSGNSFCEAIKLINDNTKNKKKIYISSMYMTTLAKSNIKNYCINNKLMQIEICFNDSWIQIRRNFIKECCLFNEKEILQFEKICLEIYGVSDKNAENIYGYGSVGDGISFVNWTPNTTIPMLWKNGKKYVAIFSRSDYPFGNRKFWKKADITKLKSLAIYKIYYHYAYNQQIHHQYSLWHTPTLHL